MVLKGHLFDELVEKYLNGGNIDLESIKSINSWFSFPSWLTFLIGAVAHYYFYSKIMKKTELNPSDELKLIRNDKYKDIKRPEKLARNGLLPATSDDFRKWMKYITEMCVDYYDHPDVYDVRADVKPGFLFNKMPKTAPENPDSIENLIREIYADIIPNVRLLKVILWIYLKLFSDTSLATSSSSCILYFRSIAT